MNVYIYKLLKKLFKVNDEIFELINWYFICVKNIEMESFSLIN